MWKIRPLDKTIIGLNDGLHKCYVLILSAKIAFFLCREKHLNFSFFREKRGH